VWESRILKLGDDTVLVECGPMRMFISAYDESGPKPESCVLAAEESIKNLESVARNLQSIKKPYSRINAVSEPLHKTMLEAVKLVGDADLTPMAAIAGTLAEATADFLTRFGLAKIIVNNGGDIAVRLAENAEITIGIRPDIATQEIAAKISLSGSMKIGGICTSGLGGRSFTRGIASAATIFASKAAIADAAATAVANATYLQVPAVTRIKAELIDPDTDLQGVEVTKEVGDLSPAEIDLALENGLKRSEELVDAGVIFGAVIAVKSHVRATGRVGGMLEFI
jgi:uncharacterized protein